MKAASLREPMSLTIDVPQDVSAVVLSFNRDGAHADEADAAGRAEYDSWSAGAREYDSWSRSLPGAEKKETRT